MTPDEAKALAATLESLAHHMSDRISYAESRRTALMQGSFALLAGGVALLPLAVSAPDVLRAGLYALAVGVIIAAVVSLLVYLGQTNFKYGFIGTEAAGLRPWKWFYRDALPNSDAFNAPWHTRQSDAGRKAVAQAFKDQWDGFSQQQVTLVDPKVDALQNLEQVYVLHVNERYKNLFLSQLRTVIVRGIVGAVALAAITILIAGGLTLTHTSNNGHQAKPSPRAHHQTAISIVPEQRASVSALG